MWEELEIAGYLFCGGLAGASSILAAAADASGRPRLANRARLCASAAITVSFAALIKDLGRPERFVNMLRVFKPTSPMSVGTWILSAYAPLNYFASATTIAAAGGAGRQRRRGRGGPARLGGRVLHGGADRRHRGAGLARGLPRAAVPVRGLRRGGGRWLRAVAGPVAENAPAARMALLGSAGELIAERLLERRLGPIAETLHSGVAGRRMRAAKLLTAAGLVASATSVRRSRVGAALTGAALLTGSALTRFGLFAAGMESARDPRYTVGLQRARAGAGFTSDVYPAVDRGSRDAVTSLATR